MPNIKSIGNSQLSPHQQKGHRQVEVPFSLTDEHAEVASQPAGKEASTHLRDRVELTPQALALLKKYRESHSKG